MSDNEGMSTVKEHRNTPSRDADVDLGKRAHMLMWSHGLKQGDVAKRIGMSSGSLGLKLKGNRGWALAEIIAIAEVLNSSVGYLVGEHENPHPNNTGGGSTEPPSGLEPDTCALQGGRSAIITQLFPQAA